MLRDLVVGQLAFLEQRDDFPTELFLSSLIAFMPVPPAGVALPIRDPVSRDYQSLRCFYRQPGGEKDGEMGRVGKSVPP